MGSLLEYHVLLYINKTQETAINQLFVKKGWTFSCQELNEEIVSTLKEKLSKENHKAFTKDEFDTETLKDDSEISLSDVTEQDDVRAIKSTRQSKRKSSLPTRKTRGKTRLKSESGHLKKSLSDAEESYDPLDSQKEVHKEFTVVATQDIEQSNGTTREDIAHRLEDLESVSENLEHEGDSYGNIKDEVETDKEAEHNSSEKSPDTETVVKESGKQKREGKHKRKGKHIGRLKSNSKHSKLSNQETKCKAKKSNKNKDKDTDSLPDISVVKKPRLEDGKVPDEELPISCFYCDRRFAYEKYLKKHMSRVHPQFSPGMFCEYCGANFKRRPDLYAHIKEAHPDRKVKNIQCDLCGNVFRSKGAYVEHINAVHTDERAFKCDICNKAYKSYRVLKIHKLRHGPAQEICGICGKMFRLRSEVKHHMRRHQNDRRIQCETCDKVFYRNSELKNHQRTHTGEKPYKCDLCPYACTIKGNLDKHMKTHDENNKTWSRRKKILLNGAAVIKIKVNTQNSDWTSNIQNPVDQNFVGLWPTSAVNEEKNAVDALQQCDDLPNPEITIEKDGYLDLSQRLVIDEFRNVSDRNNYLQSNVKNPVSKTLGDENVVASNYQSSKSSQDDIQLKSNEKRPFGKNADEKRIPPVQQSNQFTLKLCPSTQALPTSKIVQWNTQTPYVGNTTMGQPTLAVLQPVVYAQMKPSSEMQWCPPRTDVAASQSLNQDTTQSYQENFY